MQVNDVAVECDAVWLGTVRIPGENPARNATYAHAQDFAASDELLLAILKAFVPQPLNKQQTIGFRVF
jgi:hypothetical protein